MTNKSMEHQLIKASLEAKNITFSDIAKAKEVSPTHVVKVSNRGTQSLPVAKAICLALDKSLEEVFGDVDAYFSPAKRGRPDRSQRTAQVVEAIRKGQPVPDTCHQVYA